MQPFNDGGLLLYGYYTFLDALGFPKNGDGDSFSCAVTRNVIPSGPRTRLRGPVPSPWAGELRKVRPIAPFPLERGGPDYSGNAGGIVLLIPTCSNRIMEVLVCPNCSKTSGLGVYSVVTERGVLSSFRWLLIDAAPDGHLEGDLSGHLPQRWGPTSRMRCSNCGQNAPAAEFGATETVELNHDLSTLGLSRS
jgi:hypothetical protein